MNLRGHAYGRLAMATIAALGITLLTGYASDVAASGFEVRIQTNVHRVLP